MQGDLPAARSLYEQSLRLFQELGDKPMVATVLYALSSVAYQLGDLPGARPLAEQSLALRRELHDSGGIARSLRGLGFMSLVEGDLPAARSLYEQSLTLQRQLGDKLGIPWSLYNLAVVSYIEEDYLAARSLYKQSLILHKELGFTVNFAVGLVGLGAVAAGLGEAHKGARLLGAAEALLQATSAVLEPDDRIPYEQGMASARAELGAEKFVRLWQEGRAMTREQAIAYALEEESSDVPFKPGQLIASAGTSSNSHESATPGMPALAYADDLTEREVEVLRLIAAGKSNAEIAFDLVLSLRTVERHISNVYQKIGAHGKAARVSASTYAARHGLIAR